ncbi:MAG: histidine kinase [Kordiimonadales bacterium]|nr:MAG: histidine kinase [Kordiimonadales bacterium]
MFRIMAVNAFALVILVGSVLYLNQFRQKLIDARVSSLQVQAAIISGALAESAADGQEDATDVDSADARVILTRLVGPTNNRARLFAVSGRMTADSRFLAGDKKLIEEPLPHIDYKPSFMESMEETLHRVLDNFTQKIDAPPSIDRPGMAASDFIEVQSALKGIASVQLRKRADGKLVINVAVPIQRYHRVLGGFLLTAQTGDIDFIVRAEQILTVKVFIGALLATVLLSFFLGRTLVRPIRILARAAERVRRGVGRDERIPEFANRLDEIGDLSRSLSDMTGALYKQIDAVERFAADVAHEIKNPLTSMRSALETMEIAKSPEAQAKLMAVLHDDVRRIDRLISDISDLSRLDAELTRGKSGAVDLGIMLNVLANSYRTTRNAEGHTLSFPDQEAGIYLVHGIESRLGQVWRNLIDNALSFSPEGGRVWVEIGLKQRFIVCTVEDEGPGVPEGAEDKIFKRFYSERPEQEQFGCHSGLGLSICKQVIEAHGGRLMVENRTNDVGEMLGARFIVRLPLMALDISRSK